LPERRMLRVAVIGAGAAGLCVARHVLSRPDVFAPPVVFELSGHVGGTWCYEEGAGRSEDGRRIHSSMYRDLRTNLPKEVMMFPDFPFDPHLSSFLPHQEVRNYLEQYCQEHEVGPRIRFNTAVEKVTPAPGGRRGRTAWEVKSSDPSGCQRTDVFDSVFVCSGHYSDPYIPDIPGIANFKGKVLHSHDYRYAEPFSALSVVVLGAKASGLDISIELASVGAQVFLSHGNARLTFPLPSGIQQSPVVTEVDEDGNVCFQDGSVASADVLMFCTGYKFKYPFLDAAQLGLDIQDHLVSPLYLFMMPPAFPSLFFIGICKIICPFPHFNCQVQFALAALGGGVTLPSRSQMEDEVRRQQQDRLDQGVQQRHLLVLDQLQWDYCDALARAANFTPLPPVVRSLYQETWRQRRIHPQNYRRRNYRLVSDSRWEL
uniref:Flavin-containing monooxygenase n=1 Tax=Tetraodon nigroviridis TaxID=99883 RepID=H3CQG1_TETNG